MAKILMTLGFVVLSGCALSVLAQDAGVGAGTQVADVSVSAQGGGFQQVDVHFGPEWQRHCCANVSECHCYLQTCYDIGYHYCQRYEGGPSCEGCEADHCCCCDEEHFPELPGHTHDIHKCKKPDQCTCIDKDTCCAAVGRQYCDPRQCKDCPGRMCCCVPPEPVKYCNKWDKCMCTMKPCEQEPGLQSCRALNPLTNENYCGDKCKDDRHCCCCPRGPVCPVNSKCACQGRPCDEIEGWGFCDPDECNKLSPHLSAELAAIQQNKKCPNDRCCCKIIPVVWPSPIEDFAREGVAEVP